MFESGTRTGGGGRNVRKGDDQPKTVFTRIANIILGDWHTRIAFHESRVGKTTGNVVKFLKNQEIHQSPDDAVEHGEFVSHAVARFLINAHGCPGTKFVTRRIIIGRIRKLYKVTDGERGGRWRNSVTHLHCSGAMNNDFGCSTPILELKRSELSKTREYNSKHNNLLRKLFIHNSSRERRMPSE